jgi:hypothetical protein
MLARHDNESLRLIEDFGPFARASMMVPYAVRARLGEISVGIEKKAGAVRAKIADPQPQMFPLAVTFLIQIGQKR